MTSAISSHVFSATFARSIKTSSSGLEEVTLNEAIALTEKVLDKKLDQPRVSVEELEQHLQGAEGMMAIVYQYQRSLWVRGDNTIAKAKLRMAAP